MTFGEVYLGFLFLNLESNLTSSQGNPLFVSYKTPGPLKVREGISRVRFGRDQGSGFNKAGSRALLYHDLSRPGC